LSSNSQLSPSPQPFPTPYNHLEGALALSQGIPVLIIGEEGMDGGGIFGAGIKSTEIPSNADKTWVDSTQFSTLFAAWKRELQSRRDIFLGYCGKSSVVAEDIRQFLEKKGYSIKDWARDFRKAGATILEEIEKASTECRCAVFLFTKDDEVARRAMAKASFEAIPRDNVLVEAGYFTRSHGKSRVAIIREEGAKMPVDFGGIIYLSFKSRENLKTAKMGLVKFLKSAL
jgi:hypothetical protein